MEQSRCSVIKHLEVLPKYGNENVKQRDKYLLPRDASIYNHPSLLLPPILSFGHLAYPPTMVSNNRKDYYNLFPPIGFNQMNKSLLINLPPESHENASSSLESRASASRDNTIINNLTNKQHHIKENKQEPLQKKAKFDFSIEALTAKPHQTENKKLLPLRENNSQNIVNSSIPNVPMPICHNKGSSTSSIKSRGRPSADLIELLKQNSIQNPHRYSCSVCHRSFPRKKSLDTHRLTHSDVKPYACDFPGCNRKFKQSGQLKTHLRLHTGEKPFKCTFPFCETAFTHANRKCSQHPEFPVRRSMKEASAPQNLFKTINSEKLNDSVNMEKVKIWFEKHLAERDLKFGDNKENIPPIDGIKEEYQDEEVFIDVDEPQRVPNPSDENNKRLLSAVALVELRDQMKQPNNKENYAKLFSTNHVF